MCNNRCLQVDEKIIGFIGILIGGDYIIGYIAGVRENIPFPIVVVTLIFNALLVISSVLLILGIANGRHNFLWPFLVVDLLILIRLLIVFILNMVAGSIILFVLFILNTAFWTYCGLCIFSLYRKMRTPGQSVIA